eukprot:CAMPEP_0170579222 /NCGR_PEP_ID=MMETSP0224-20130122/5871_1 /TAXON_ID=285029 /ORGANISM="Togula jolla, Strain CCCM 725" /LENGTH=742 /DNA_ID=CAMNT_0010902237 /DNA_START=87 /DNA_END=2315 /DNA_ORIENTATION=-
MGFGLEFYSAMASRSTDLLGYLAVLIAALLCLIHFVFDWNRGPRMMQIIFGLIVTSLIGAGMALNARTFPAAPLYFVMCMIPFLLGILRTFVCPHVHHKSFHLGVSLIMAWCAVVILALWVGFVWFYDHQWNEATKAQLIEGTTSVYEEVYSKRPLDYASDCGPAANVTMYDREERKAIDSACDVAHTIWFLAWSCPLAAVQANLMMAVFAFVAWWNMLSHGASQDDWVRWSLKQCMALLVVWLAVIYFCSTLASADLKLASALSIVGLLVMVGMFGWFYVEIGPTTLFAMKDSSEISPVLEKFREARQSDWGRAVFIGAFGILVPAYLFLDATRQMARRGDGRAREWKPRYSPTGQMLADTLAQWDWVSIFSKICILGELYFTFAVGFSKLCYVFLSWLNQQLLQLTLALVLILALVIGALMFLFLPPLPGVAVYLFCGILAGAQAQGGDTISFPVACVVGLLLAIFCKLLGSSAQYILGYFLGGSLQIQALVGVDKVFIRALEQILKRKGLDLGKVSVLVGGPDWPTSVLCGVLRVNLCQMLLGTLPMVIVLTPTVLAGAFQTKIRPDEEGGWGMASSVCMAVTAVMQPATTFLAAHSAAEVIESSGNELAKSRPEHREVEELRVEEAEYHKAYRQATVWNEQNCIMKAIVVLAAILMVGSCEFFFLFGSSYCFRPFTVSGKISDPFESMGLNGDWLNIVRAPMGWAALAVFGVAVCLHIIFERVFTHMTSESFILSDSE